MECPYGLPVFVARFAFAVFVAGKMAQKCFAKGNGLDWLVALSWM
jgi:hypothetical protein